MCLFYQVPADIKSTWAMIFERNSCLTTRGPWIPEAIFRREELWKWILQSVELQYVCTNRRLVTGVASRLFWHNCVRSSLPHLLNLIIWVYFVGCAKSPSGSKHKGLGPVNAWSCLNSVLTTTLRADWFQGFHSAIFFFKLYYSYFSSRVSLITSGFVQTVTIMSNQYVHARNHQSKSLTTILGLPRNAILPAIHDFPGGPMTGDKLRRYMAWYSSLSLKECHALPLRCALDTRLILSQLWRIARFLSVLSMTWSRSSFAGVTT